MSAQLPAQIHIPLFRTNRASQTPPSSCGARARREYCCAALPGKRHASIPQSNFDVYRRMEYKLGTVQAEAEVDHCREYLSGRGQRTMTDWSRVGVKV